MSRGHYPENVPHGRPVDRDPPAWKRRRWDDVPPAGDDLRPRHDKSTPHKSWRRRGHR